MDQEEALVGMGCPKPNILRPGHPRPLHEVAPGIRVQCPSTCACHQSHWWEAALEKPFFSFEEHGVCWTLARSSRRPLCPETRILHILYSPLKRPPFDDT